MAAIKMFTVKIISQTVFIEIEIPPCSFLFISTIHKFVSQVLATIQKINSSINYPGATVRKTLNFK
jgi:hypothetical protein